MVYGQRQIKKNSRKKKGERERERERESKRERKRPCSCAISCFLALSKEKSKMTQSLMRELFRSYQAALLLIPVDVIHYQRFTVIGEANKEEKANYEPWIYGNEMRLSIISQKWQWQMKNVQMQRHTRLHSNNKTSMYLHPPLFAFFLLLKNKTRSNVLRPI